MVDSTHFLLLSFWRSSATFRARVALYLKGTDVEERFFDLDAGEQHDPEFSKLNPMGAIPALIENGWPPLTASLAIVEYLDLQVADIPTVDRILARCNEIPTFADAEPRKQRGAPAGTHQTLHENTQAALNSPKREITMKALTWHGTHDVRIDHVADPEIQQSRDAIIKVTATAICGSDLHLYNGVMAAMQAGDVLGHEFMGEVVETGADVPNLNKGDRVVVPFTIACGHCFFCNHNLYSLCDESNPNADQAAAAMGHSPSALFGYSHMLGGIPGGQAEYVRVPYADIGPLKVQSNYSDEQLLFLSDIYPTGWMGADNADIEPGDTVAVWGCGPVAQFAIRSAWMLGAGRVIAVDRVPERLQLASEKGGAEVINFENDDVYETLQAMTRGYGPDRCIDAVGAEAHGAGDPEYEKRAADETQASRPGALNEMIRCCRKGGQLSLPGVYTGPVDGFSLHALMNKGLSVKSGQTHMQQYMPPLLETIEQGLIDPSFIITHRLKLDDAPDGYATFNAKQDNCIKVVLTP